ncbi:endolytic transglycosylase MltG [Phytoactinopolyspora alkaliphila]|uniref:Endolytic murein transglycosylase n=1 Tax=Phytoactinopolyspora alkaliphila TaxID=1783498 RepID=A0A6N9YRL3_9ACTN|nr:endolytic transglycosylase MltG [Phytoactinopolyspora alkaliphila]NED97622.1 endolytic transglycosylase MltG [Phytoactinopolyspora alkaliphila]
MSYVGNAAEDAEAPPRRRRGGRRRKRKKRKIGSFFAVILSLAVVGGLLAGIYYGGSAILGSFSDMFEGAEDYPGPGTGEVTVTIEEGASLRAMGGVLEEADVVASREAFVQAAESNGGAIQPGTYTLAQQMSAEDAVTALIEGGGVTERVTVPEGFRERQTIARLARDTEFDEEALTEALESVELPDYAEGEAEGFLFPATYDLRQDTTPEFLLQSMVDRFDQAERSLDLTVRADERELSVRQVVTVASIIQREVGSEADMPLVADVIYNRLSGACADAGVPDRRLQMDSTVHYAVDDYSSVFTSREMRQIDSPYNTYVNGGLPPGPIASPGESALAAAVDPAEEGNCYFVTVNLETGETKFAATEAEHNANVEELRAYCRESDQC